MNTVQITSLPEYRHQALGDVSSTNSQALLLAREGDPGNIWVTAVRQTSGRGRRGRSWVSEPGNLYASLLLIDPAPADRLGNLPLVAAVAVHETIAPFFADRPVRPQIKWPNDILIGAEKVNGILLESEQLPDGGVAVAVGCGINCAHHPQGPGFSATDLAACGVMVTPEGLFPRLAAEMDKALVLWSRGLGFASIRRLWLDSACGLGGHVKVNLHDETLEGVFEDIDEDGYLLLRMDDGALQLISAGDLFFPAARG